MIRWEDINLDQKRDFEDIINLEECISSRCSFVNLFIWKNKHLPCIYLKDKTMLIKLKENNAYYYPRGNKDLNTAINLLKSDANDNHLPLKLIDITEDEMTKLKQNFPNEFEFQEDRDASDYIYKIEKLCYLKGRNLSSKRNHINNFIRKNDWEFKVIDNDNKYQIQEFAKKYFDYKKDETLDNEKIAINLMIKNFEKLNLLAGMIYIDNTPVAFSAGALINNYVFDVHFELAYDNIQGAYNIINREFSNLVKETYPDVKLINREEDLGLPGLRKAKLSYLPDTLLKKYIAIQA